MLEPKKDPPLPPPQMHRVVGNLELDDDVDVELVDRASISQSCSPFAHPHGPRFLRIVSLVKLQQSMDTLELKASQGKTSVALTGRRLGSSMP